MQLRAALLAKPSSRCNEASMHKQQAEIQCSSKSYTQSLPHPERVPVLLARCCHCLSTLLLLLLLLYKS
jgi:hypothetical protein